MNEFIFFVLPLTALLLAVAVLLTKDPKTSKRLTVAAGAAALVGGLVIYGYGYVVQSGDYLQGFLHAIFSVCRMFIGDSDFGEFDNDSTGLFPAAWMVSLIWLLHVLAFYATSSAAISIIGANALKKLRVRLSGKNLNIIYGVRQDSVNFGLALSDNSDELLIYVTEDVQTQLSEAILESNAILRTDAIALSGNEAFLRTLGMRKRRRKLTLYALDPDYDRNYNYADALKQALKERGVPAEQISLVILGKEDACIRHLQIDTSKTAENAGGNAYGYGFVMVFSENDLAARLLIQKYPPCNTITFNKDCTAAENFEALIIGFGPLGQLVLRNTIMNSQFIGSDFRADVFEPDIRERSGHFVNCFPAVLTRYHVEFHPHDGRSEAFYAHVSERLDLIKHIVVCTGNAEVDEEIAEQLQDFISRKRKRIPVYRCSARGIKVTDPETVETTVEVLYHPDVLVTDTLDRMAMAINQSYNKDNTKGAVQDWMVCDYFSRQSNRACADFIPAVLRATGKTEKDALSGPWTFTKEQMSILGQMEHARWNAFHFCNGYATMSDEEFEARAAAYRKEKAETGKGKIRISKNIDDRTHACLVSWDDLRVLSEKEAQITGMDPMYQVKDTDNINKLPDLLRLKQAVGR